MTNMQYRCLSSNQFSYGIYTLVPIRSDDQYFIMQWRNEQLKVLRQKEFLTVSQQTLYFSSVVHELFNQEKPQQLLFSFLEKNKLIGYGGLVHIDWESRNAEISFLTDTERTHEKEQLVKDWCVYLKLIKTLARDHLHFLKIYTYAYDIRPHLYGALLQNGFIQEARLKNHVTIDQEQHDVLIHSCFLDQLVFRMANEGDMLQYYEWANEEEVRSNSYSNDKISFEKHREWFLKKLNSDDCYFYLFLLNGEPIGQVRIDKNDQETVIGISIDKNHRGKSFGEKMLVQSTNDYLSEHKSATLIAYIKEENIASLKSFRKAGFSNEEKVTAYNQNSYKLYKNQSSYA